MSVSETQETQEIIEKEKGLELLITKLQELLYPLPQEEKKKISNVLEISKNMIIKSKANKKSDKRRAELSIVYKVINNAIKEAMELGRPYFTSTQITK